MSFMRFCSAALSIRLFVQMRTPFTSCSTDPSGGQGNSPCALFAADLPNELPRTALE